VDQLRHRPRDAGILPGDRVRARRDGRLSQRATAAEFLAQARREMAQARRYFPGLCGRVCWPTLSTAELCLPRWWRVCRENRGAEWALVVLFGLGMLKGVNRATLAKAELPQCKSWFDRYSWTHTFWVPLATWVWLYVMIASAIPGNAGRKAESPP